MGFGAGVLISAVAYELVEEGFTTADGGGWVAVGLFAGALTFFVGDELIGRWAARRKSMSGEQEEGTALAIVLGIVLDGIPESAVIGLALLEGGGKRGHARRRVPLEPARGDRSDKRPRHRRLGGGGSSSGCVVTVVSALAALAGYGLFDGASPNPVAFVLAFAGGAILTMLAETMMPEAYLRGGKVVGLATTLGFAVAFAVSALD